MAHIWGSKRKCHRREREKGSCEDMLEKEMPEEDEMRMVEEKMPEERP